VVCLAVLLLLVAAQAGTRHYGGAPTPGFHSVTYGQFAKYGSGACPAAKCITGDSWFDTWADNDTIYTFTGDTASGWNGSGAGRNMMYSSLDGYTSAVTGATIGDMVQWGTQGQAAADSADWKASGAIAVHGTAYMFIYRHAQSGNNASLSMSLIKSADRGVNWVPLPPSTAQPYATPMFTDQKFRMASFVQYPNKDYTGQTADRSAQFVYAISPDTGAHTPSTATAADVLYLARVPVATIGNQAATDWQFYQGGDGALDSNWGALSTTVPIMNSPGCACHWTQQTMTYLPYWKKYILIDYKWNAFPSPPSSIWDVYQGDHPWGPWVWRQGNTWASPGTAQTLSSYGFYMMGLMPKSVAADGGQTFTLLTTGDYNVSSQYTMYIVPVTVNP
jgi:hypothetical protein